MTRPNFDPREEYIGAGNQAAYTFDFKITSLDQLLVLETDQDGVEVFKVRGTDVVELLSVTFDPEDGGGTVTLPANLPANYNLVLMLADDAPTQPYEFNNRGTFNLKRFESAMDYLNGQIQRLAYLVARSIKLDDSELDADLPSSILPKLIAGTLPRVKEDLSGFELKTLAELLSESGGSGAGLPPGGVAGDYVEKLSSTDGDADWMSGTFQGFSLRFSETVNLVGLRAAIAYILNLGYLAPTVVLSASGSSTIREKGDPVTSTTLTAAVTKNTDPIAAVRFYRTAVGLLQTYTGTIPNGGNQQHVYGTSFSDNASFYAEVDDDGTSGGPTTVTSNTVNFTFVYPYYYGSGAAGLTGSGIAALTKYIIGSTSSVARTFTPNGSQVMYFAYPASYGDLTSILDQNGFETLPDWTKSTKSITGLDGNPVNYTCYEYNNTPVSGTYPFTFIR